MKRSFLTAAAVLMIGPAAVAAQAVATGTVNVTATVSGAVSFNAATAALAFGTLAPTAGNVSIAITDATVGKISMVHNTAALVTAPASTSLTGSNGGNLTVTLACGHGATDDESAATAFTCTTGHNATVSSAAQETKWFFVGGSLSGAALAAAPAGVYTGTVTFTASYNN